MSLLIEMPDQTDPLHLEITHNFHAEVAVLLECPEYRSGVVAASTSSSIRLILPKTPLTFVKDTQWIFELKSTHLKTVVTFVDSAGTNLMRAQSERMKLQLMILLRLINSKLPLEENYSVDPRTGIVQYAFQISWKQYRQKLGRTYSLRKLFAYMLCQLNFYAEILLFCEGGLSLQFSGKQFYKQPPKIQAVNIFRFLLRNTSKFREANVHYFGAMVHLKEQLRGNNGDLQVKEELQRTLSLFQNNVRCFQQLKVGLQEGQSEQKIENCLKHIANNARGFESNPSESNIVKGIEVVQRGELKSFSKEGAHSEILRGRFLYRLYLSTNPDFSAKHSKWTDGKEIKGELVVKKCNSGQSSINSFLNQIHFLNYIRDSKSSYIARYYLQIKRLREVPNEKDLIYMRPYTQNLHGLVKKSTTLSILQRLSLSYKLAKGFCFLGYRSVLHRDFKPHNIVMDQTLNPFIIDFGSCVPVHGSSDFRVCEPRLLATKYFHIYYHELPQEYVYLQSKFTREQYERHPLIDVYSFGRILSFLFFKSIIPPSSDDLDIYPYPDLVRNIYYLVGICLQVDPDDRPTFAQIASFLGTLDGYTKTIPQGLQLKIRSCSQPKPKIQ